MFIESIILYNYRAYRGHNKVSFDKSGKNIFVVAGNNGFGKTTFLTSLVWCLYGKLMVDVDDKFRREINDSQGYKNYSKLNLNKVAAANLAAMELDLDLKRHIARNGYSENQTIIKENAQCYVEVNIVDTYIPAIPSRKISIRRTYDYFLDSETTEVLIDGQVNELAKEVGYDIFINDFILSKDIAKFFFFDAEKIVNLAEVKSLEEKRRLSTAYSEVLGIKKYEDIKRTLENLRLKLRKNAGAAVSVSKLERLTSEVNNIEQEIEEHITSRFSRDERIATLKIENDALQERLIREGNAMSVEDLDKQKALLKSLQENNASMKARLRDMLDIAPFAISGSLLYNLKQQLVSEQAEKSKSASAGAIVHALKSTHQELISNIENTGLTSSQIELLTSIINDSFAHHMPATINQNPSCKVLLDFTPGEINEFQALYDNLRYSFSIAFKQLVKDLKNNTLFLLKTQKKIQSAEQDNSNAEVALLREQKNHISQEIIKLDNEARTLSEKIGVLNKELTVKKKQLTELSKTMRVDDVDKEKDIIAERLIGELNDLLLSLRSKRKKSLETKIKSEIDLLMHKSDFINKVRIDIEEDMIDINLLDNKGELINKEKLSKGEQQLYATAILKALVDESNIEFPVFIDSPLQKFDSIHSRNIITKFYPTVSKQVVIFPLLGKELSLGEYEALLPNVNRSYIINNQNGISSLVEVEPAKLFESIS